MTPTNSIQQREDLDKLEPKIAEVELQRLETDSLNEFDPHSGVKRALKNRHISLLALGGIIGPGCLIGAGNALNKGGPLALLLGFGIIGLVCFSIMESIGELVTLYPSGGGFITLARRFHSEGLSAVSGYAYIVVFFAVLANEYNTISSILQFLSLIHI